MARNTPTEILDNVKKLLVKDIINLWDTANINNNAGSTRGQLKHHVKKGRLS